MKHIFTIIMLFQVTFCTPLYEVYENAEPMNGYDKYLILDKDIIYTGEIGVYEGNVFIEGNGAVINLNQGVGIWVYADENYPANLDAEHITIVNSGDNALTFNGTATGNIINCNFINNQFGIQIMDESEIIVKNCNFINNEQFGIAMRGTTASFELTYSNFWENELGCGGYNENC